MISFKHKALFVHIPKCGGQSVETAFLNDLGLNWAQRAPLLLRPKVEAESGPPRLAHLLAKEYVANHYISQDLFDAFTKFTVVRDPYKRVVSFYKYFELYNKKTLTEFVHSDLHTLLQESHDMYWFFRPQVDYILDGEKNVLVDEIFYLERLDEQWPAMARQLGLNTKLPHVNKSKERSFSLTAEDKQVIQNLYADDFSYLRYSR